MSFDELLQLTPEEADRYGMGGAWNLGQDETVPIDDCLALVARLAGRPLAIVRLPRERLLEQGLLPACSPFSGLWMSELDNRRSREELKVVYTPFPATLERLGAATCRAAAATELVRGLRRQIADAARADADAARPRAVHHSWKSTGCGRCCS